MNETKELKVPDHGYVNELAKLCGCSRQTVRNALRTGMKGEKSDMVRKMYRTKYLNKH
jgi:DeoR/GlpR family transcriptional regulator of sugar metabolism